MPPTLLVLELESYYFSLNFKFVHLIIAIKQGDVSELIIHLNETCF